MPGCFLLITDDLETCPRVSSCPSFSLIDNCTAALYGKENGSNSTVQALNVLYTRQSFFKYNVQLKELFSSIYTANEEPLRIQYKFLVPIYVFPEMKLLFVLFCCFVICRDLYISRTGLPILLQGNMWTDPGNI
jgi:hypothetical protein